MKNLVSRVWNDEAGFVVSSELVLIGTILVIGLVSGLTSLRDQVVQELGDLALAIASINQSYSYSAVTGHSGSSAGSIFQDRSDYCDGADSVQLEPACIDIDGVAATTEL
ncbi:MAG: hypothetical protein O2955_20790 [Planctomycetota bacterium]|nr:hypothetical protein [Planctomycetota bacterium]